MTDHGDRTVPVRDVPPPRPVLPGADLSNEELTVRVLPKQEDEFTCSRCFLVQHRSRLAATKGDQLFCRDCAA